MTTKSKLEEALEYLINEDEENAVEAFHNFIVQKARAIHESLIEDDEVDEDVDESLEEETDEEEVSEADEAEENEEVDEDISDARHEIRSDEYFGREELTAEDEDMDDEEAEMDLGDEAEAGEEMDGEEEAGEAEEDVTLDAEEVMDLKSSLDDLQAKFAEIMGDVDEVEDEVEDEVGDEFGGEDMGDMEEPAEEGLEETGPNDPENVNRKQGRTSEFGQYVGESDDDDDDDDLEEAVSHDAGVQKDHKVSPEGKHGSKDNIKHNEDAKLPESAEFDFDLTEEDFLDLEEGLKQVDVKMGGEQGGEKFAGEETNTKSPVAQRDKSDVKADSKSMPSKQTEHGTYDLESSPNSENLPHSGDNSHDSAEQTGSPKRSEVSKGGGLEKQKGYGEGEVGAGKFAGTEKNVKSPMGSSGTRNES